MDILGYSYSTGLKYKYHYDRSKFQEINTEEDAYWLGFITADGRIVENEFLKIKLAERDKGHLIKFCKYLKMPEEEIQEAIKSGFGGVYTKDNPVCVVKICSKEIMQNLLKKGIIPRKSGKEKPYKCKNPELEKAYIRGLIDGDGYLGFTNYRIGLCGSYEICEYTLKYIGQYIVPIDGKIISSREPIYGISFSGRHKATKVIKYLYENASIYLDRKYKLYLDRYSLLD